MVYRMIKIFTITVTILNAQMVLGLSIQMEIPKGFLLNLVVCWQECIGFEIRGEILKICSEQKEGINDNTVEHAHQ